MVPYTTDPFLSYAIARSVVAALPPGKDRDAISAELSRVDRLDPDPLADLRERPTDDLGGEAEAVVRFLSPTGTRTGWTGSTAGCPKGCARTWKALAARGGGEDRGVRRARHRAARQVLPAVGGVRRRPIAGEHRVTVTEALDHAEPGFDPRELPAFVS
jgi:hypothetical protein